MLSASRAQIEEIEKCDIYWFEDEFGISLDLSGRTLGTYQRTKNGLAGQPQWTRIQFPLEDIRSIEEQVGNPKTFEAGGLYLNTVQGGLNRVGDEIGAAGRNAYERRKARKRNGIVFSLRSSELPKFFIRVIEDVDRRQLLEILRQVLEGRKPDGLKRRLPEATKREIYATSDEATKKAGQQRDARADTFQRVVFGLSGLIAVCFVLLVGTVQLAKVYYKHSLLEGKPVAEASGLRCYFLSIGGAFGPDLVSAVALEDFQVSGNIVDLPVEIRNRYRLSDTVEFSRGDWILGPFERDGIWLIGHGGERGLPKTPVDPEGLPIRRLEPRCG